MIMAVFWGRPRPQEVQSWRLQFFTAPAAKLRAISCYYFLTQETAFRGAAQWNIKPRDGALANNEKTQKGPMNANDLSRIRAAAPLVHNITNYVVMNTTANALLALGASPVMAHASEEVEAMAGLASALVINIGTLSPPWVAAMHTAARVAAERGIPIVLDPVGCGATPYRTATAQALIQTARPTLIDPPAPPVPVTNFTPPEAEPKALVEPLAPPKIEAAEQTVITPATVEPKFTPPAPEPPPVVSAEPPKRPSAPLPGQGTPADNLPISSRSENFAAQFPTPNVNVQRSRRRSPLVLLLLLAVLALGSVLAWRFLSRSSSTPTDSSARTSPTAKTENTTTPKNSPPSPAAADDRLAAAASCSLKGGIALCRKRRSSQSAQPCGS